MRTIHFTLLLILVVYDCIQPTHQGPVQTAKRHQWQPEQDVPDYSLGENVGNSNENQQGAVVYSSQGADATSGLVEERLAVKNGKLAYRGSSKKVNDYMRNNYEEEMEQQDYDGDSNEKGDDHEYMNQARAEKPDMTRTMKKSKRQESANISEEEGNEDEIRQLKQLDRQANSDQQGSYDARKNNNEEESSVEQLEPRRPVSQKGIDLNTRHGWRSMKKLSQPRANSQAGHSNSQYYNIEEQQWGVSEPATSSSQNNRKVMKSQVFSSVNDSPSLDDDNDDYLSRSLSEPRRMYQKNDDDEDSNEDSMNRQSSQNENNNWKYGPKMNQNNDNSDDEDPFLIVPSRIAKRGMFPGMKVHGEKGEKGETRKLNWSKTWKPTHIQPSDKQHHKHWGVNRHQHQQGKWGKVEITHPHPLAKVQEKWGKVKTSHPHPHPLTGSDKTVVIRQAGSDSPQVYPTYEDYFANVGEGMSAGIDNPPYYPEIHQPAPAAGVRKNRKESSNSQKSNQQYEMSNRILRESTNVGQNARGIYW